MKRYTSALGLCWRCYYIARKGTCCRENTETWVIAIHETGLEINADKAKYMAMSLDQNAGRIHGIKIENTSFERVEELRNLGKNFTDYTQTLIYIYGY